MSFTLNGICEKINFYDSPFLITEGEIEKYFLMETIGRKFERILKVFFIFEANYKIENSIKI